MYNNAIPPLTMGANVLPQAQMPYGYAAPACFPARGCDDFIIIVVLFILLIIIGAAFC